MTGQGHAVEQSELGTVSVEVRTVNNRGFKCSPRLSDALAPLENKIEAVARSLIHRGSVYLNVSYRRPPGQNMPTIDTELLEGYTRQLQQVRESSGASDATIDLAALIQLPGVIVNHRNESNDDDGLWKIVESVITKAIDNLNEMRSTEGGRMAETLIAENTEIGKRLEAIRELAPRSQDTYRNRLETKIKRILEEREVEVQAIDLLREVQIYADRADISEEVTRLDSHLQMFADTISGSVDFNGGSKPKKAGDRVGPTGRKLDFIIQEMFRETNTIGSKAADSEISGHVVEVKCAIERMRELVQNLE